MSGSKVSALDWEVYQSPNQFKSDGNLEVNKVCMALMADVNHGESWLFCKNEKC